jgi:hypothetical protein
VPWLASGPYFRARRPRPSEEIPFASSPGLPPQGLLSLDSPPRGGAGSARPEEGITCSNSNIACSLAQTGFSRKPPPGTPASACQRNALPFVRPYYVVPWLRARRPRPSEKTAPSVIPGFAPQGPLSLDSPPRGGAGSARPERGSCLDRGIAPLGHQTFAPDDYVMPWLASGLAISGRGDRAPPRKPPFALSRAFHRKAILAWMGHPRGGAGSARPEEGTGLTEACPHYATATRPPT